jgi:hypothetical protein
MKALICLLLIVALRGQSVPSAEATRTYDGCNWHTCDGSGLCSVTTVFCPSTQTLEYRVQQPFAEANAAIVPLPPIRKVYLSADQTIPVICGIDSRYPAANIDLIQVGCIDFDRLRAVAPEYPWPPGKVTQVIVHAKSGDAVRVTVDGVTKWADLVRDSYGRLAALVQFDGAEHTAVEVRVFGELR